MVLEGAYGASSSVLLVHVWGYELLSDLSVFLDDMLVFNADLVIDNLEVDIVASRSEVVHNGVVGCNTILVLLGIEGGDKDCVGVTIVGSQDVLITTGALMRNLPMLSVYSLEISLSQMWISFEEMEVRGTRSILRVAIVLA